MALTRSPINHNRGKFDPWRKYWFDINPLYALTAGGVINSPGKALPKGVSMKLTRLKFAVTAAAVAAFVAAAPIEASATHKTGHVIAAGAVGLGLGLLLGQAAQPRPVYAQPRPVYVQPQPVYQKPRRVVVQEPVYEEEVCVRRPVWQPDGYGGRVRVIRLVCE
jgi:hypothetical protein